ncbi:hypothetical protein SLA2020_204560 [Shorea laevis]
MEFPKFLVLFLSSILISSFLAPAFAIKKSYVVYLGSHSHGPDVLEADLHRVTYSHHEFLASFVGSVEKAQDVILYSYIRHINGFSAILDEEEAAQITKHPKVVSVFPDQPRQLHTTNSWHFMFLENNYGMIPFFSAWKRGEFGKDVIIANLDSGVWPESRSFSDHGMGPVPSRWKGTCETNHIADDVHCNRKVIGARYFNKGYLAAVGGILDHTYNSPRDDSGHGSHTLSTAGGNFVIGASLGNVTGTAKGGSPHARVATYKVCWPRSGCYDSDILAGFDMAIHDGADIISVSLGADSPNIEYFSDSVAVGAFHAVKNGITVVASAGNAGPLPGTVVNAAPWIITVGASTQDREFRNFVRTPNGMILKGNILSEHPLPTFKFFPMVNASEARFANSSANDALLCMQGTLDPEKVKGKILVCQRGGIARLEKGVNAANAGAVGMILYNDYSTGNELVADPHVLPATHITYKDGLKLSAYLNSTANPLGFITPLEVYIGKKPAPVMAEFSSRGPNVLTPEILKPDITAPGVDIIAAYSEGFSEDGQKVPYNMLSGTSMSCPHVSGVAGLIKAAHPEWSPAAVRSAIMTTARTWDNTGFPILDYNESEKSSPFNHGAGHISPNKAQNPGLVYDLTTNDYLDFLCAIGYNETIVQSFSETPYKCPKSASLLNFNYPSIVVPHLNGTTTVTRKLKNVGAPGIYVALVREPLGISATVEPKFLRFVKMGEEKSFKMTLTGVAEKHVFGDLTWTNRRQFVRSPIVVTAANSH